MNCFEWQNRSSDYLDGTLIGLLKQEADQHLEACETCLERYKHYRLILSSISTQPRATLPVPVRGSPLTAALPRLDAAKLGRSRWERIPWYVRTAIEATAIVLLILAGISTGPKLRTLYERGIERNLSELSQAFTEILQSDSATTTADVAIPLSRGKAAGQDRAEPGAEDEFLSADETDGAEGGAESEGEAESEVTGSEATATAADESLDASDIHVGNSEVWRFILKTDSPHEFRAKIVAILTGLKIPATTPGLGGVEAPGGIQFDLLLPKTTVAGLKRQLQAIAPPAPEGLANTPGSATFTWFKNKSKRNIPEGRTRVVIWLSQM